MNIRALFQKYLGWCPGVTGASGFDQSSTSEKVAAIVALFILLLVPFAPLNGIYRFILLVFAAFIGVPICWKLLRGEKAGPQEGTYPDQAKRPLPHEEFGEFNLDSPDAEVPIFGPSRSSAEYNKFMLVSREWLHPDILWFRRRFLKKKIKREQDEP